MSAPAPRSDVRIFCAMGAAAALAVLIALSALRFAGLRGSEATLDAALASPEPERALELLDDLDGGRLTAAQRRRRDAALQAALQRLVVERPPLREIGKYPFEASRAEPYRFPLDAPRVTILASLEPARQARWIKSLRVGDARAPFGDGRPPMAVLTLELAASNGEPTEVPVALIARLPGGSEVELPLPNALRLVRDGRCPEVRLLARDRATPIRPSAGEPETAVFRADESFSVEVADATGIVRASWTWEGREQELEFDPKSAPRSWLVPLPPVPVADGGRVRGELAVSAANALGNQCTARLRLDLRHRRWHPVTAVTVNGAPLDPARVAPVRGPSLRVRLEIEDGELEEAGALTLRIDGNLLKPEVVDGGLEVTATASGGAPTGILLLRGDTCLASWRVEVVDR